MWGPLCKTVNIPEIWARGANAPADDKFGTLLRHCKHVFILYAYAIAHRANFSQRSVSPSAAFPKVLAVEVYDTISLAPKNYSLPELDDVPLTGEVNTRKWVVGHSTNFSV
ncbi:hypothetical protein DPSP01_005067 [Paraphaeosphaeria sporulosa]